MAYGISASGAGSNTFVIDSNTTSTEYLGVFQTGTFTAGAENQYPADEIIFAKPAQTTQGSNYVIYDTTGTHSTAGGPRIRFFNNNVSFVRLKKTTGLTATSGTYGILIRNAGNTIIYDSRKSSSSGFKITGSTQRLAMGGGPQFAAASGTPTLTLSSSSGIPGTGSRTNIIQSGSLSTTYMMCGGAMSTGKGSTNSSINVNQFYYDYAGSRILHFGYFAADLGFFGGQITLHFSNHSDIFRGELIT